MKMSLCNTFRLFAVSLTIVLSTIDTPAAFTLHRSAGGVETSQDLVQEGSVIVEKKTGKHEIKRTDAIEIKSVNLKLNISNPSETNESSTYVDMNRNIETSIFDEQTSNIFETTTDILTTTKSASYERKSKINDSVSYSLKVNGTYNFTNNESLQSETTTESTTLGEMTTLKVDESEMTTSFESEKLPLRKKYNTINRKRQPTKKNAVKSFNKKEEMSKSETKNLRVSLHDTVTSDIPSLEQLKNELLYSKEQTIEILDESLNLSTTDVIEFSEVTTSVPIFSTEEVIGSTRWETVESKRAGYLDLSEKIKNDETLTAKETSEFKFNSQGTLRTMFEIDNIDSDIAEEQTGSGAKSQGQLNDDTIKEELLKEKIINENEQNVKRFDIKEDVTEAFNSTEQTNSSTEEKLSVRPINSDKIKNISLYSVSPNYKPLKKIEVQPPKQFVRDPDDNTWRNESLNSLGIVFKSKNSSKPFTQVLKNKTEAELNNLSEKDIKNDIPDLKERLQKMAEKRKSKRKKTDSLGNVVYFYYEENSSSREHITKDELPLTSGPETTTNVNNTSSSSETPPPLHVTTPMILTTDKRRGRFGNTFSTKKFKNFFNIPEYYDTTEEDDEDYLNMAKIDIKKFSTSKTTPTTTVAVTPHARGINRFSSTISPERKATIQYFPPLTTQKVNVNDYDTDFKIKVNSFTTNTEPPNSALPITLNTPRFPDNTFQYNHLSSERPNNFVITNKPRFEKNFYSTEPPQTTQTAYTLLNEDGTFDRDSYVVKHYKDFINEAAKANDFDKNMEYVPYTQTPEKEVTKAELIKYVTEKAKVNMDQEYDYETHYRKDVLQKFVDNFNQNSERYKSQFPILFNSSIIHRDTPNGREVASSRAFMRGLYNTDFKVKPPPKETEDNNDNITVELSPSYELHYYMPEQEEKEEVVQQPVTLPYPYRL